MPFGHCSPGICVALPHPLLSCQQPFSFLPPAPFLPTLGFLNSLSAEHGNNASSTPDFHNQPQANFTHF